MAEATAGGEGGGAEEGERDLTGPTTELVLQRR